ncbi:MAG TPA: PilZ domain-containing protein [Deltaproteobacteria bacterium]|nr:PilZ domain-containing protein [Deltaproteobacteria bacterium]HPR56290.1 PilZ domain-containing protein [Deltaproteobacteria bacterium]HXK46476.1 PilZ domain-containing protein [Deltaproteobacteria bacterium]
MEKRENKRKKTQVWEELQARARIGDNTFQFPVVDISIGGIGVLVTDGFSLLHEGTRIDIETLEKKGRVIATEISGRIAHLGSGVPSRVGIDFSPADTPIEAFAQLNEGIPDTGRIITDKEQIRQIFENVKNFSRGFGDMLMMHRQKAIPAEFFYLRPEQDNMVLRIVRISDLRLPFQPQIDMVYPFYLFKGIDVMLFTARVNDVIKNIMETTWPDAVRYISRRSVLRYLVTGEEPLTATLVHPISAEKIKVFVWDISIDGLGVELLGDKTPLIEGMNLSTIWINLPKGPVKTMGVVRSVRKEKVLDKTQVGIEFTGGMDLYQDTILKFILEADLPSEIILRQVNQTR